MPVGDEPSGLRPDAPKATRQVRNSDGGDMDRLSVMAVADVEDFWSDAYGPPLEGEFYPVAGLFSYDSRDPSPNGLVCDLPTDGEQNAFYCHGETKSCAPDGTCWPGMDTISWDRGWLIRNVQGAFGDNGVALVLGHEYGHALQTRAPNLIQKDDGGLVYEQQADCFAGVYLRWVVDGKSPRFTLNTGDGLNGVLAALLGLRDNTPILSLDDPIQRVGLRQGHGSAFERISAFQMGFQQGKEACNSIHDEEILQRRGNLPVALREGTSGENPVTEESVILLVEALHRVFTPEDPAKLTFDELDCPDTQASPPVSYCPTSNTIVVDLGELQAMSFSISRTIGIRAMTFPQFGDYTAYSVLVSRYAQSLQEQKGVPLDGRNAGLRTACLTGVATAKIAKPVDVSGAQTIGLTAGDLDEAAAGLLVNGLAASDVNGKTVPSGFARIDAFRAGVLGDADGCYSSFE